jgi:hypothetical protein
MNRIHTLCSAHDDRRLREITFSCHLKRHGYQPKDLYPLFNKAIISARAYVANPPAAPANQTDLRTIQFLHLEYHPRNPAAHDLQSIWQDSVAAPLGKVPLAEIENLGEFPCPTTETTRLHRVATVPTGTSEMVNKTVATTATHSNRSNAISSSDSRTVEETTRQAHQTTLLVENTAGVELHACVPDQGTGAAMGADRAIALRARRAKYRGRFWICCIPMSIHQA